MALKVDLKSETRKIISAVDEACGWIGLLKKTSESRKVFDLPPGMSINQAPLSRRLGYMLRRLSCNLRGEKFIFINKHQKTSIEL